MMPPRAWEPAMVWLASSAKCADLSCLALEVLRVGGAVPPPSLKLTPVTERLRVSPAPAPSRALAAVDMDDCLLTPADTAPPPFLLMAPTHGSDPDASRRIAMRCCALEATMLTLYRHPTLSSPLLYRPPPLLPSPPPPALPPPLVWDTRLARAEALPPPPWTEAPPEEGSFRELRTPVAPLPARERIPPRGDFAESIDDAPRSRGGPPPPRVVTASTLLPPPRPARLEPGPPRPPAAASRLAALTIGLLSPPPAAKGETVISATPPLLLRCSVSSVPPPAGVQKACPPPPPAPYSPSSPSSHWSDSPLSSKVSSWFHALASLGIGSMGAGRGGGGEERR